MRTINIILQPRLSRFLHGILSGSEHVLSLLADYDTLEEQPQYIRASRYKYKFTTDSKDPNWWTREFIDIFTPTFSQPVQSMSTHRKALRTRKNRVEE